MFVPGASAGMARLARSVSYRAVCSIQRRFHLGELTKVNDHRACTDRGEGPQSTFCALEPRVMARCFISAFMTGRMRQSADSALTSRLGV